MNKNIIIYVIIALLLIVGVWYTQSQSTNTVSKQIQDNKAQSDDISINDESIQKIATTTVATNTNNKINKINKIDKMDKNRAKISTSMGDIVIEFNTTAPKTVENFKTLMGKGFYDGVRFHRVIKDFMIQTGDPNSKDKANVSMWGMGGPGYKFADELSGKEQYTYGTVAMANSGPNTNGSQFFIVSANPSAGLLPSYTVFAHVVSGMDIVDKIQNVKTTGRTSVPNDKPLEDILITSVKAE